MDRLPESLAALTFLAPLDRALAQLLASEANAGPRVQLLAALTSRALASGHVCLELERLFSDPDSLFTGADDASDSPEKAPQPPSAQLAPWFAGQTPASLAAALAAETLCVGDGNATTPLVLDGLRLYLLRNWRMEQALAQAVAGRLAAGTADIPATLPAQLATLFAGNTQDPDWQRLAVALATRAPLQVITGGPGTGKTTTVLRLLALLQENALYADDGRALQIRLAAPTGKAAARLSESIRKGIAQLPTSDLVKRHIPDRVSTLHRLLGAQAGTRRFRHHAQNPLPADVVVVDEASMIDLDLAHSLFMALAPNTRLILLGDKDQLASVEAGAVLAELCREASTGAYSPATLAWLAQATGQHIPQPYHGQGSPLAQQTVMLRESRRFASDSGIGQLATAVNANDPETALRLLEAGSEDIAQLALAPGAGELAGLLTGSQGSYRAFLLTLAQPPATACWAAGELTTEWAAWLKALLLRFDDCRVLCALRQGPWGVSGLNTRIAAWLQDAGLLTLPAQAHNQWYAGRPVLVLANDYGLNLMNGDIGITVALPAPEGNGVVLRVAFPEDSDTGVRLVSPARLANVDTAWAMTVHKSQGSEFGHAILLLPDRDSPVLTRELIYTGITRAKSRFTLAGPQLALLPQLIARATRRSSGLGAQLDRLWKTP
ncbi:exodeoxyribonuclease V subunit alpha [Chitinilyticum piscinae]|uniref:RecBCD enzyme subunit RecD n=1 Tax=Chitinilyticum piscinae TaxID=2866724 RepID=A0A8J7K9V2_9NEIS|nr:exodeoxyribonuclease V subunit alpha [Chitinilyticum piscinae]MBE9608719.1 exodeoxyribonuclease V subunit alpha [Chitinilyticum piscinae]